MTVLEPVREGCTATYSVSCRNELDVAIVPESAAWTLRDTAGAVVNGRSAVVLTPAQTMSLTLTPADMVYDAETGITRQLTISISFASAFGGTAYQVDDFVIPLDPAAGKAWGL